MGEIDVAAVRDVFETASSWSEWSTIAVAVGVFIELVALFVFSKEMPSTEKRIMVVATAIIVAGCAGEFVFGSKASNAASQLQQASDQKIAGLTKETARLSANAESSRESAAKTEERVAAAEKATANARERAANAELALQRVKAPRTLSAARQQFVADATSNFAGQRYRAAVSQSADDAIEFWQSIYGALKQAGWVYLPLPPGSLSMGNPPAGIPVVAGPGVEILFDPAKEQELLPAALALGNALHADGMVVAVNRDNPRTATDDSDVILIRIGVRVLPK
jgi:hypothetical protein